MGIRAVFNMPKIRAYMDGKRDQMEQEFIKGLIRIGRQCVEHARNIGSYQNRTGRLRSSNGFVVVHNGKQVHWDYEATAGNPEGVAKVQQLINRIAAKHPEGIALIVANGMHYAVFVEAMGRDVITGSYLIAKAEMRKLILDLKERLKR